jgi:hypothetical protein
MKIILTGDYFYNYGKEQKDFLKLKSFLENYDASVINWEGSYRGDDNLRIHKSMNLEFSPIGIKLPSNSILCLSNNHILDYGVKGLERTIERFELNGIRWFGIQDRRRLNENFHIYEIAGIKICLIGFGWKNEECRPPTKVSPGVVDFTRYNIDSTFNELEKYDYDFVISYVHTGYEYEYYPLPHHVELSRLLVDKGSDIVYQSHTHCIQPYEVYNDKYIFYGLGNFYFSSLRTKYPKISDKGIMVEVTINANAMYEINIIDIKFNRNLQSSSVSMNSNYLDNDKLIYENIEKYSNSYRSIRTRKINPRPIMHYNRPVSNYLRYNLWLAIVKITGFLRIRGIVKALLRW